MQTPPYELKLRADVDRGRDVYAFDSADGVVSKDEFRQSELLLLGSVEPDVDADVLDVDANYGVVGTILADLAPEGQTLMTESSARATRLSKRNADRNGAGNAAVALTASVADVAGDYDVAAYAPKPYDPSDVVKQKISDGMERLRDGGEFYLAANRNEGAKRYERAMTELAGNAERVEKVGECRAFRSVVDDAFEPTQFVRERSFDASVGGVSCGFETRPGLFSATGLDEGTRLLLEELAVEESDRLLDLACGYGPVGVFAAKRTGCDAWFTDDSVVATEYAGRNAADNGVSARDVVTADCLDGVRDRTFDVVAANPPTHAGEGVVSELFRGARDVLADGGRLFAVYNRVMGLDDDLATVFDSVDVRREEDDYRIAVART